MKGILTPKQGAQEVKQYLTQNKLLNINFHPLIRENKIVFPLNEGVNFQNLTKQFMDVNIIKENFRPTYGKKLTFKEALIKLLSQEEQHLLSGFDQVGDIAILEICPELKKKEKEIAKIIIETNSAIKTVVKKSSIHHGTFRTQKMSYLAGKKTLETLHRESGIAAKLDISKVYFSPRLAEERKRVYSLVKPGERVLVMFSGMGIYPLVISKNTDAQWVYGIELNPKGHKYAQENKILNNLKNITFINGDASKELKNIVTFSLGLKAHWQKQLAKRIEKKPRVIEFFIRDGDAENKLDLMEKKIIALRKKGFEVMLHAPYHFENQPVLLENNHASIKKCYGILNAICKKYNLIGFITHATDNNTPDELSKKRIFENLKLYSQYLGYLYLENSFFPRYPIKFEHMIELHDVGLKNTTIDVSHYLNNYKSLDLVLEGIKKLQDSGMRTYFHFNDYNGTEYHFAKGGMLFENPAMLQRYIELADQGVVEVTNQDEMNPVEMSQSYDFVRQFKKHFDRIVMPLPKDAADFLDSALSVAKKGTVIHFYDFCENANVPEEPSKKVIGLCKKNGVKCKVLNVVKCGQYSPYVSRVCVDFEIC